MDSPNTNQLNRHLGTLEDPNLKWCRLCLIEITSIAHGKVHFSSRKHRNKMWNFVQQSGKYNRKKTEEVQPFSSRENFSVSKCKQNDHFSAPKNISTAKRCLTYSGLRQLENQYPLGSAEPKKSTRIIRKQKRRRSKQKHSKNYPQIGIDYLKQQYPSVRVDDLYSVVRENVVCMLCYVKLNHMKSLKEHIKSSRHINKFRNRFPASSSGSKTTKISLNNNKILRKSNRVSEPKESKKINVCYLCKTIYKSKQEIDLHTTSFPHQVMLEWKVKAVSLGVLYAEHWLHDQKTLLCLLCNKFLKSSGDVSIHNTNKNHQDLLHQWAKGFKLWKCGNVVNPKHFYCTDCNIALPGTDDSDLHYESNVHLRNLKKK